MSRKLFLSFLGTNNYIPCNYYDEENSSKRVANVRYVQEALIKLYCSEFSSEDKFYFFLTDLARKVNWESNSQWNRVTRDYDYPNVGLRERLAEMKLSGEICDISISEGFSTDEIWNIFDAVFSCMEEYDEIYLDITHAFRYIPMLGMVLLNYSKILRNVVVKGIYYGAFEKLGPSSEVKKKSLKLRDAPILNLLSISELQDWTNAASAFTRFGNASDIVKLTKDNIAPILKETKGQDDTANGLRRVSQLIDRMAKAVATNRGKEIYEDISFDNLNELLQSFSKSGSFVKPLNAVMDVLAAKVATFSNYDELHWLKSARWCVEHGMYQQAITQLQEGVITFLCNKLVSYNSFFDWGKREPRNLLTSVFSIIENNNPEQEWKYEAGKYPLYVRTLKNHPLLKDLAIHFNQLTDIRNDINHAGYKPNAISSDRLIVKCKELMDIFEAIDWKQDFVVQFSPLLNLSNHPVSTWTKEQLEAAQYAFGEVVDLAFPNIPPDMDEAGLNRLVEEYYDKIKEMGPAAVHIMGEMTFTCRMVEKLKAAGINCVASTTLRKAEEKDGKKLVEFHFVRFRKY